MASDPPTILTYLFILIHLISILPPTAEASIGVNYGTAANDLPPPLEVARFLLQSTLINRVRIFDPDPELIRAFAHTGIELTLTVPNHQIPNLSSNFTFAQQWLNSHVIPFLPPTNIVRILVGNEVLSTADKLLIDSLVPAMRSLHAALVRLSLDRRIQVSTPHSLGILSDSVPPSAGKFHRGYDVHVLKPLLTFLRSTNSPFMINPYPFFACCPSAADLDYALFRPNPGVLDENTKLRYTNMLDAQLDAVFSAMKSLGFADLEIAIAETGWPSRGHPSAGIENAALYNRNLISHVSSGAGTPLMPNRSFESYIFALFNEDRKPGPVCERSFGLFNPDLSPAYDVGILRPTVSRRSSESFPRKWCVAKEGADVGALQRNIDYVCGTAAAMGAYWCGPIQEGGECFLPDTVRAHASFAMNAFYQAMGRNHYDCEFQQTGEITTVDPSLCKP
ncbi:Glucan endo-1,3-beta-glucosidase [Linum grandiflorum]